MSVVIQHRPPPFKLIDAIIVGGCLLVYVYLRMRR